MLVVEPLTNRAIGYRGHTTPVNCRMADDMVAFIDQHLDYEGGIASRSDFVQHWTRVGMRVMEDPELTEALEWALDRPVQPDPLDWKQYYGPVTITQETLDRAGPRQSDLEAEALRYEPPTIDSASETMTVPEGAVVVLSEEGGKVIVPDEVDTIHEAQLEALRSRLR
jgi:hypothetical protein